MQGILYEEPSVWLFLLVTLVLGGGLAYLTGKACAETWRSVPVTVFYLILVGMAVRFAHFALFEGTLLSLRYYLVDSAVVQAIGLGAWRLTRAGQMAKQYWWIYERTGPFTWAARREPVSTPPGQS